MKYDKALDKYQLPDGKIKDPAFLIKLEARVPDDKDNHQFI